MKWLLLSPLLLFIGLRLQYQAREWLTGTVGGQSLRWSLPLLMFWLLLSHSIILAAMAEILTPLEVFRGLVLASWCFILLSLDVTGYWMPFSFTAPAAVSGLLFTLFLLPERSLLVISVEAGCVFLGLSVLRWLSGQQREMLGMGDVCLLTALTLWFPLYQIACATALAIIPALIVAVSCRQRQFPFGLYLCPAASLLPFISVLTQGYFEGRYL